MVMKGKELNCSVYLATLLSIHSSNLYIIYANVLGNILTTLAVLLGQHKLQDVIINIW